MEIYAKSSWYPIGTILYFGNEDTEQCGSCVETTMEFATANIIEKGRVSV